MHTFHSLKLYQDHLSSPNNPITLKEIEAINKSLPIQKKIKQKKNKTNKQKKKNKDKLGLVQNPSRLSKKT